MTRPPMQFAMKHKFFEDAPAEVFTESDAPAWLTSVTTRKGSTMDNRWFWEDHVLTLAVGAEVETDFWIIWRVA